MEPSTPLEREVLDACLRLVAAGAHLVVRERTDEHLGAVEPARVTFGRRVEWDRDMPLVHVDEPVLIDPVVAPGAVLGHLLLVGRTGRE